jgi:hypothetical protein
VTPASVRAHFVEQAKGCAAFGSPFTAALLERCAQDLDDQGPVAALVAGWPGEPRADALGLRLAGALHAAALSGRDPALAAVYPGAKSDWTMDEVWPQARAFLADQADWVRAVLQSPPQTNEVRRSIGLLPAFLALAAQYDGPMEMLELGASAGLNLSWDQFAYETDSWRWNPSGRPLITTDWSGPPPQTGARPQVRARAGCDQNPLSVHDPDDVQRLRSYIWADQADRLQRFDAAVAVAQAHDVGVERADAAQWIKGRLASRARDAMTVVYHSIFVQYPPAETLADITAAITAAGATATAAAPLAWVRFEPASVLEHGALGSWHTVVDMITWPGAVRTHLADVDPHGRSVRLIAGSAAGTG